MSELGSAPVPAPRDGDHLRGPDGAPVLIAYADYECPFCAAPKKSDEEGLIVARGESVYAVLNLYPYNPGHLLICPYRHVADYTELTEEETVELAQEREPSVYRLGSAVGVGTLEIRLLEFGRQSAAQSAQLRRTTGELNARDTKVVQGQSRNSNAGSASRVEVPACSLSSSLRGLAGRRS